MSLPIKLISTDFDGTLFAEFEKPPVPEKLQALIGQLQHDGAKWVINTGRDLSSLMESLGRSHLSVKPDFLVVVERDIYCHVDSSYVERVEWNHACNKAHSALFRHVRHDVPRLTAWVQERFAATVYEDAYSPFCLIAENNADADVIYEHLIDYCKSVPNLMVNRNDVYARFSHTSYHKGTALSEIARSLGIKASETFAAGDHLNDVPMLSRDHAHWLAAPSNAIDAVKAIVRAQKGCVSLLPCGHGVADGLEQLVGKAKG